MKTDEFRAKVYEKAGPDLTFGAVSKAVEMSVAKGRFTDRDVADCIMYAGRLGGTSQTFEVPAKPRARSASRMRTTRAREHPEVVLDQLLAAADPVVRHTRRLAFGADTPPFRSMSDARAALKADEPSEEQRWRLRARSLKTLQIAEDAAAKATAMDPFTYSHVSEQMDTLLGVLVAHESRFGLCARQVRTLAKVTGLSGMVEYVLAGVRPTSLRPSFSVEEDGLLVDEKEGQLWQVRGWPVNNAGASRRVRFPRVTIEIPACLVTESEFRNIYAAVRKSLGLKNQRSTSHRDQALISTVERHGGRPHDQPNRASFWKAVVGDPALKGMFPSQAAAREAYPRAVRRAARASG